MKNKILYIILALCLFSCKTIDNSTQITEENTEIDIVEPVIILEPELTETQLLDIKINNIINNMSVEQKIGQLLMIQIRGYTEMTNELELYINSIHPGGIILFANNIINDDQVLKLNKSLQSISEVPLFISVDEEGGVVSRLGKNKNVSVTYLPPALTVGSKNNPELAFNSGKILSRELKSLGFNMDMAPVADVNTNPNNPVIGNRTYSDDPFIVADMIEQFIYGMNTNNVISVLKHFPGHGDTSTDSHLGTVVSPHSRERLDQVEFIPFKRGIDINADAIMTAHIIMPGISSIPLPATLNRDIITGILRDEFKYNGIVITDAMDMGAISQNFKSEEAALTAINAGIDIVLIPLNQQKTYNYLLESYKAGNLTEKRLNESVYRIIKLKLTKNIISGNESELENIKDIKNDEKHINLIQTIIKDYNKN
ncbi:MAG: glycoside hydrolase family 3 protein [Spirochaetales bacterium]|nr:glycoside hydrolase family 3 protein [Spirochaetales bacterium]